MTLPTNLLGALTSQVNSYVNGNVLTADMLNSEFANIYSTINALDNANLISSANISPSKISGTIDGDGISRNGGTGALSVSVDGTSIDISSDQVRVKPLGITSTHLAANSVATTAIQNSAVTNAKIADDAITGSKIAAGAVVTSDITDNAVTKDKIEIKTATATAGVGMVAMSSSSGASAIFIAQTDPNGDIPNNTVTLTTRGGPVLLQLLPGPSPTVDSGIGVLNDGTGPTITFSRAGTVVDRMLAGFGSSGLNYVYRPPGAFAAIDVPAAGTYVYKASYIVNSTSLAILNVRLMAYEL